jgi:hypothetical protein
MIRKRHRRFHEEGPDSEHPDTVVVVLRDWHVIGTSWENRCGGVGVEIVKTSGLWRLVTTSS